MPYLHQQLQLDSCPHCGRANPTLNMVMSIIETNNNIKNNPRWWGAYACKSCGGIVTAFAPKLLNSDPAQAHIRGIYPDISTISDSIPQKPRELLRHAQNSLHAPPGAIMLCASAVDAMLKLRGYKDGNLYQRINKAAEDHLITTEMAKWAHQVRLDANDQRHADEEVALPTDKDAKLVFDFATSFAQYLFVLPAMVSRGINDSGT